MVYAREGNGKKLIKGQKLTIYLQFLWSRKAFSAKQFHILISHKWKA